MTDTVGSLGVANTEAIVGFLADAVSGVLKFEKDGSFVADFIPLVAELAPAISAVSGVGAELKALTFDEDMTLINLALSKFQSQLSAKAVAVVTQALVVVVDSAKLVSAIKS